MAVLYDTSGSVDNANANSQTVGITVGANSDRILLAFTGRVDSAGISVTSVVWNTTESFTHVGDINIDSGSRFAVYRLLNPTAGAHNVVASYSGAANECFLGVISLYNVDQTTPLGTLVGNSLNNASLNWGIGCAGDTDGMTVCGVYRETSGTATSIAAIGSLPRYINSGALSTATSQTERTPAAPVGGSNGMVEIATCASENNDTHTWSGDGWEKINQHHSGTGWTVSFGWRRHDGTNVDPTISWTNSADANARRHLYMNAQELLDAILEIGTFGAGTTSTHTSTGGNTTKNNSTVAYLDHSNANTALGQETGWTERVDSGSATGPCRTVVADKEIATSGTGSGDISVTGGNAAWVQKQLEILCSDGPTQNVPTQQDDVAGFGSAAISYETGATINQFGFVGVGSTTVGWMIGAVSVKPAAAAGQPTVKRFGNIPFHAAQRAPRGGAVWSPTMKKAA